MNLLKEGSNDFKIQIFYDGKLIGENSIPYIIEKFKLKSLVSDKDN